MSAALPSLGPGVRVEIVNGAAKGAIGKVKARWRGDWANGVSLWLVGFDGLIPQRVIRADYLQPVPSDVEL